MQYHYYVGRNIIVRLFIRVIYFKQFFKRLVEKNAANFGFKVAIFFMCFLSLNRIAMGMDHYTVNKFEAGYNIMNHNTEEVDYSTVNKISVRCVVKSC